MANPDPNPPSPNIGLGDFTGIALRVPSLLRSSTRNYQERCAHIGCSLLQSGDGYCCCVDHQGLASFPSAEDRWAFHYRGGFINLSERQRVCCICLLNRCRDLQVGIPTLESEIIFTTPPWDLGQIFSDITTSVEKTDDWLFFTSPPKIYKSFVGLKTMKWHMNKRRAIHIQGITNEEEVFWTPLHIRVEPGNVIDPELVAKSKLWQLHLFQCRDFSLYSLSRPGVLETEPTITSTQSNKRSSEPPEKEEEEESASGANGTRTSTGIPVISDGVDTKGIFKSCDAVKSALLKAGVRAKTDHGDNYYTWGSKYSDWEQKGVPLRIEIGPRDLAKNQVRIVRRDSDTGAKADITRGDMIEQDKDMLGEIQRNLFDVAKTKFQIMKSSEEPVWEDKDSSEEPLVSAVNYIHSEGLLSNGGNAVGTTVSEIKMEGGGCGMVVKITSGCKVNKSQPMDGCAKLD